MDKFQAWKVIRIDSVVWSELTKMLKQFFPAGEEKQQDGQRD